MSKTLQKTIGTNNYILFNHRCCDLGSLGTSVFDSNVYLVGASGGVYALLAAHLANVMLVRITIILLISRFKQ